jgi:hypothetical protein
MRTAQSGYKFLFKDGQLIQTFILFLLFTMKHIPKIPSQFRKQQHFLAIFGNEHHMIYAFILCVL